MTDVECREFITQFIDKIEIYEERQPNGKWIKDVKYKIPMLNNETLFGLDNFNQLETCCVYCPNFMKQNIMSMLS